MLERASGHHLNQVIKRDIANNDTTWLHVSLNRMPYKVFVIMS